MLLPGYLSVLRCGVKAGMPQMLLEKPQSIPRVIQLYRVDSKRISKAMGTYASKLPGFRIDQIWEPRSLGAFPYHLPCSVSVDAKDKHFAILGY